MNRYAKGRIARTPGTMNKAESDYAGHLALEVRGKLAHAYAYEAVTLRLANGVRYTPDFLVVMADGAVEFHEVKGATKNKTTGKYEPFIHEAGRVKLRVAARLYPYFVFKIVFKVVGVWQRGEVEP